MRCRCGDNVPKFNYYLGLCFECAKQKDREFKRNEALKNPDLWLISRGFPYDVVYGDSARSIPPANEGFKSWVDNGGNTSRLIKNKIIPALNLESIKGSGFWFYGMEGSGKTGLGARIFIELLIKLKPVSPADYIYKVWPEVWREYNEAEFDYKKTILDNCGRKIVFLDEVLEKPTEAQVIALKRIIDMWQNSRAFVIVATNPKPTELEKSERECMLGRPAPVTSRLLGMLNPVAMTGNDFRRRHLK